MKVGDNKSRPSAGAAASRAYGGAARTQGTGAATGAGAAQGGRVVSDSASIMGVPETELTPAVRSALMTLMGEVAELRRELDGMKSRLRDAELLADHDPLLPLLNRRAFVRELARVLSYSQRHKEPAGLVYVDLDGFKQLNDAHGHAAGDEALKHVAKVILSQVRESDFVGRLGGDEFGVIMMRADEEGAKHKALQIVQSIAGHPITVEGVKLELGASAGAVGLTGTEDPEAALKRADVAMYRVKRGGGT